METLIEVQDGSISNPDSDSDTNIRHTRSVHFNDRDIREYNIQYDLDSTMLDSSVRMSSSDRLDS